MATQRYEDGRRSRLKPDAIKRIGDFWREIAGIVIGVIVGSFISFIADGLSQTDYYDVAVFLVPFVCAAILAYSAYLFRASRHVSDQCNQRLTAMMDKMTASQLVIMRQDITLIVKDGYTEERITVEILNRTGSVYRTYRFGEYADAPFEGGRWIEIWRDGARIQDLTLEDMNYHEAERQSTSGRKYVMPYEYDIYIPLNLRPNESCTLEVVKRRSNSFCNLFKGELESQFQRVHHPTRIMSFNVIVDPELHHKYRLKLVKKNMESTFFVLDDSENRLYDYEASLAAADEPTLCNDWYLRWVIAEPIIDLRYQLHIGLETVE